MAGETTLELPKTSQDEVDHRKTLYADYTDDYEGGSTEFDKQDATRWVPALKYYFRNWLPSDKRASIVDLGCGNGRMIYGLQRLGYLNVQGVDISAPQLALAKQISDQVIEQDVLHFLRQSDRKYDLILACDLIEHLRKNEALEFLDLCVSRLADNGRLVLQTPNAASPFFGSVRYGDFTHETAFTPELLCRLLRRVGLRAVSARETPPVPVGYSMKSTLRFILWASVRLPVLLFDIVETGCTNGGTYTRVFLASGIKE